MLHPVGPLPASVYWRRRLVLLAVGLVVLVVGWLAFSGGGPAGHPAAASGRSPGRPSADPGGTSSPPPASLAATPPAVDPGAPPDGGAAPAGARSGGRAVAAGATTGPAPGNDPPDRHSPAQPCPDSGLTLQATPARAAYQVGDQPVVRLTVANVTTSGCTRDVGGGQQEVLLYSGGSRIWSSNDCYPGSGSDLRTLRPGDLITFTIDWSGLSSQPACAGTRVQVGAGHYALVGRLGSLRSPPATLVLR